MQQQIGINRIEEIFRDMRIMPTMLELIISPLGFYNNFLHKLNETFGPMN
jgi:hypothetical protein